MRSSISRTIVLLVCLLTIGAMAWVGAAAAAASPLEQAGHQAVLGSTVDSSAQVEECAATPPPDHAEPDGSTADVIGWVEGVWYNESISIDDRDALTETELERLTARTAARVEVLRCLTFEEVPPIEFRTQVEHLDDLESAVEADLDEPDRDFANAQFAAMFFVGQDENAMDVWLENRAATPIAFYDT